MDEKHRLIIEMSNKLIDYCKYSNSRFDVSLYSLYTKIIKNNLVDEANQEFKELSNYLHESYLRQLESYKQYFINMYQVHNDNVYLKEKQLR